MKSRFRKPLAMFLVIMMLFTLMPAGIAFGEDEYVLTAEEKIWQILDCAPEDFLRVKGDEANTQEEVAVWLKSTGLATLTYTDPVTGNEESFIELLEQLGQEYSYNNLTISDLTINLYLDNEYPEYSGFTAATTKTDGISYFDIVTPIDVTYGDSTEKLTFMIIVNITKLKAPSAAWDYFSFNNSTDDFFASGEARNYNMGKYSDDFEAALKELYPNSWVGTLNNVNVQENSSWGGSCYGYTSVEMLANLDKLDIRAYHKEKTLAAVPAPAQDGDKDVRSLLNYYYLTQFVPAMRNMQYGDGNGMIQAMAENVVNGERYMFSYFFNYSAPGAVQYGHAIMLDGGVKHADGSYTLKGYDNRYHKYFWVGNDGKKVDGAPVHVDVVIDSSGQCTVKPPSGTISITGQTGTYTISGGNTEYVAVYEAMKADASSAMVGKYAEFMPEGDPVPADREIIYVYAEDAYLLDKYFPQKTVYYIAGATVLPEVSGENVTIGKATDNTSMIAVLDKADDITIDNPTGRLALVDGNKISSVTVENASAVTLSTNSNTAEIDNNSGDFTIQVTAQKDSRSYVVYTITGSGTGDIKATATPNGVDIVTDMGSTSVSEETFTVGSSSSSSSGGGFSGVYNYPITVADVDGAAVTVSDSYAVAGETVTITVAPDAGKQVDAVIVTDADGDVIPVTKAGDNRYTFTMPAGKVNVAVTMQNADYDLRIVMQINNKNIVVNNKTITNDVAPVIVDDRTLVPVRIVTELLGGTADWNAETRTVTLTIDGNVMQLVIDEEIPGYGTGAAIIDNRTYVPIRYIAEKLGAKVQWEAGTRQIVIEK